MMVRITTRYADYLLLKIRIRMMMSTTVPRPIYIKYVLL